MPQDHRRIAVFSDGTKLSWSPPNTMADTWGIADDVPVRAANRTAPATPALLQRIVRCSLQRELEARRDRAPHAQLGVVIGAEQPVIERAVNALRTHFDPQAYSSHGDEAVVLAGQILALVEAAYLHLGKPPQLNRWATMVAGLRGWFRKGARRG